ITVAAESIQRRLLAIQSSRDATAQREVHAGRAVVGAVGQILSRTTSELGVGQHERLFPSIELRERALERDDSTRQLAQQSRLRSELTAMGVESGKRYAHDRHAG